MNELLTDCRHAVRLYVRTPGASLIAVLVLAIATACVGAFVSLYVDLALRPHPGFEQSARIATIGQNTGTYLIPLPFDLIGRLTAEMSSVDAAATARNTIALTGPELEASMVTLVSAEFFTGLRPRLALGTGFVSEDHAPDSEPVAVLSHRYWLQRFNGDPGVIGTFIDVANNPDMPYTGANFFERGEPEETSARFRIVGVMTDTLPDLPLGSDASSAPALWLPFERTYSILVGTPESLPRYFGPAFIRRAAGASAVAVTEELRARYSDEGFRTAGTELDAIDGLVASIAVQRDARRQLGMFLGGSILLALVAGANVSLFLLARAPGRRRELGIRLAIGAPFRRLARQLATEAGLLVTIAAAIGLAGSVWLSVFLRGLAFLQEAEWRNVSLVDWRVLSMTLALLLALAGMVSLAPILGLKRLGIEASGRQVATRASLAQGLAGTAQLAVAATFGAAAIAFAWHVGALTFGDPGFTIDDRYWVVSTARNRSGSPEAQALEAARWRDALQSVPGVASVAFSMFVPGDDPNSTPTRVNHPTNAETMVEVQVLDAEPRAFGLLDIRLLHGRLMELDEYRAVVVNQTLARALWGRDDVAGEYLSGGPPLGNIQAGEVSEIVGVIEDVPRGHPAEPVAPMVFRGYGSAGSALFESQLTQAELAQALSRVDPTGLEYEIISVRSLRSMRNELLAEDRARAYLTLATTVLVVLLAAFGFYGTQHYLVAAGRLEYAIRAALGSGPRATGRLVVRRGLLLAMPGLAIGALLSVIVVGALRGDYIAEEISPVLVTLWLVAGLVTLLVVASLGPALKAMRTAPAPLLRED